jgi:hypothetical protein
MALLAGSYKCIGHETRYTYEATWDEVGSSARWAAKIFYDRQLATAAGTVRFANHAGAAVQKRIEAYIEAVSCQEARGGPCGRDQTRQP